MAIETVTKMPSTAFPGGLSGYEGRRPVTGTTAPATTDVAATTGTTVHTDTDGRKYKWAYNSTQGWYKEYVEEAPAEETEETAAQEGSGGSDTAADRNSAWSGMTDAQKAAAYAANPTLGYMTNLGQQLFSNTLLGRIQNYFDPNIQTRESLIALGINPTGSNIGGLGAVANQGYAALAKLGYSPMEQMSMIRDAINSRNETQAPAPVETIDINTGERSSDYGGWGGTAADNSNRSDPGSVGSMADTAGDKTGGRIGDKPHHKHAGMKQGLGSAGLETGGFVVPADVISDAGNGSTDAGFEKLSAALGGLRRIHGKGDGLSDSIPTKIDGKQPAAVAKDEGYLTPQQVQRLGGSKRLYAMLDNIRKQAHGTTKQQRPVNVKKALG